MNILNGRPGDLRGFIHKRIFGGIKGAIGGIGGGPLGIISGGFGGFAGGGRPRTLPAPSPFQPFPRGFQPPQTFPISVPARPLGPTVPSRGNTCPPGFTMTSQGCVETFGGRVPVEGLKGFGERLFPGGATGFESFGEAVMGQYGAALVPASREGVTLICPPKTFLGSDNLCYNKRDITNKERKWPRGRRPLLTGGDMRAISIASAAAKKMQKKQKQLQHLGLLKAPSRRPAPKMLGPGHHAHVAHDGH